MAIEYKCPDCGGLLWFKTDISNYKEKFAKIKKNTSFWDFHFALPQMKKEFFITLGEGGTPCRESNRIGKHLELHHLFFKDETHNPTNSFKDRAAALLISHARSWNFQKVICASNGNQGASIAAYTSIEGMECINIIPSDIEIGKKAQLIAYNSKIITEGNTIDDAINLALAPKYGKDYYQCTPEFNPLTIEAQKTIAFEIFEEIGVPDWVIIPVGNGGCLVSIWKGFSELKESDFIENLPKLVGVQSEVCAPIVEEFLHKKVETFVEHDILQSKARSIMVKKPLYHSTAIRAINESKGTAIALTENLMLSSLGDLARYEGIFAEPASALTIGVLTTLIQHHKMKQDDNVVCLITGSGLKAPYVLEALSSKAKTAGMGGILSTKLKILSQISISDKKGIHGTKLKDIIGSVSLPAIYQHLKELESKKLIYRKKEGKKVIYFITEEGKKVLDAMDVLITLL
ncbi:MAG: threonine synthase [Promethearchaeota archaeon]|nr:MAG: threonine synthase [Candidatus Lokiarchaeota archaeon]